MGASNSKKDEGSMGGELVRLRGKIETGNVGSRGLANHLSSPCQRVRTLVAVGVSPRKAAEKTHGIIQERQPSRIAARVGQLFELSLVGRDGERLLALYPHLPSDTQVVDCENPKSFLSSSSVAMPDVEQEDSFEEAAFEGVDFEEDADEGTRLQMGKLLADTIKVIKKAHQENAEGRPVVLLQPTFALRINGYFHYVRPDVVVCDVNGWRVGEIKVYLDREGETSGIEVSSTVRQAAVGVLAVRDTLASQDIEVSVSKDVDVIFRKHSAKKASLTVLNAEAEIESLVAGVYDAEKLFSAWKDKIVSLDSPEEIEKIPTFYSSDCATTCAYNEACRKDKEDNDGRLLHDHPGVLVAEIAGVSGRRAFELAGGETPVGNEERNIGRWLRFGWEAAQ